MKTCTIEVNIQGHWQELAQISSDEHEGRGYRANSQVSYLPEYAVSHLGKTGIRALSVALPVNLGIKKTSSWPSFLIDLIPTGFARKVWLDRIDLPDESASNWSLLTKGASNPPGALRVQEAAMSLEESDHPGFSIDDVVFMKEAFIDHCERHGAPVAGSSGAGGEARKFLLTEGTNGRWHPAASLPVESRKREWILKFPRHRFEQDEWVLKAEAIYHDLAKKLGFRKFGQTFFRDRCLFVERFDVAYAGGKEIRKGLESLASAMGHSFFGQEPGHIAILEAIQTYSSQPTEDMEEYILRDMFNLALGNKDNHCRNTAFIKDLDESVTLSPWYDLCPMVFDSEGVSRTNRWGEFEDFSQVNWKELFLHLDQRGLVSAGQAKRILKLANTRFELLQKEMTNFPIEEEIAKYVRDKITRVLGMLNQ